MTFSCPQCGAENPLDTSSGFVKCGGCGQLLYIDIDDIKVVYSEKSRVESQQLNQYLTDHFEKVGISEKISIIDVTPLFFPFWEIKGKKCLERGSSLFPGESIKFSSETKKSFDIADVDGYFGVVDIDTQPLNSQKGILYYLPFYKVIVRFKDKEFRFVVNAVNGEVSGDPIPYIASRKIFKLFPLFISVSLIFIVFCFLFDHILISLSSNFIVLLIFYQVSSKQIEQKHSEK